MPYIASGQRAKLINHIERLIITLREEGFQPGHVNYVFTKIVWAWFKSDRCYNTISHIRGTLAGILSEFDRRKAFGYEDEKITENGDLE